VSGEGRRKKERPDVTRPRGIDWGELADLVAATLAAISNSRERFEAEALRRGITVEELTAAAVIEAIRESVEGGRPRTAGLPRRPS